MTKLPDGGPAFYGKYRGKVENSIDPQGLARVQVSCPAVLGDATLAWAMPCLPGAGPGVGFHAIPPVGAKIWVEFEGGNPDYPIWAGGFWDLGDAPAPPGPTAFLTKAWKGDNFSLEIMDIPGAPTLALELTTAMGPAKIEADATGLTITHGASTVKLAIDGVSINGANLKVLP
jgi:uncharacterized protein involved in type VI secretion and phage assembly